MAGLFALITLLMSVLEPPGDAIEFVDRPLLTVRVGAATQEAWGATWCARDGTYRIELATGRTGWEQTFAHELAHAYDCVDNGRIDGSPGHARPAKRPDGVSDRHWADGDDAHWYVNEVLRTGDLGDGHPGRRAVVGGGA